MRDELYPTGTEQRRVWLLKRGWCMVEYGVNGCTERWDHDLYPDLTFSLSGACRVVAGISTPAREHQ